MLIPLSILFTHPSSPASAVHYAMVESCNRKVQENFDVLMQGTSNITCWPIDWVKLLSKYYSTDDDL